MKRKEFNMKKEGTTSFSISKILLLSGCCLATLGLITAVLALTLPYWVYVDETMETTVAGLTDDTQVEYQYGLMRFCLVMKATHLDRDECGTRTLSDLEDWEAAAFFTLIVSSGLLFVSIVTVLINLGCWNKLRVLVIAIVTSLLAGVSTAVGVSLYQINASVQVLDIGGLTTANFKPAYLSTAFWSGFTSSVLSTVSSICLLLGAFTWKRPKQQRQIYDVRYKTTVRRQHCPYRGREPAVISITQM